MESRAHRSVIVSCAPEILPPGPQPYAMADTVKDLLKRQDVASVDAFAYVVDGWMLENSGLIAKRKRTRILFRPPDGAARHDVKSIAEARLPGLETRQLDVAHWQSERVHAKVLLLELVDGRVYAIIGSSNLTRCGYNDNVEVNVLIGEPQSRSCRDVFNELWTSSRDLDWRTFELRSSSAADTEVRTTRRGTLLPFQQEVYERLCKLYLAQRPGAILSLPTGAGKTVVAVRFVLDQVMATESRNVLWIAPHRELLVQAASTFEMCVPGYGREGIEVQPSAQVVRDNDRSYGEYNVEFVTVQAACEAGKTGRSKYDAVVVDEAHYGAAMRLKMLPALRKRFEEAFFLGLTGTPFRTQLNEMKDLKNIFGELVDKGFEEISSVRDASGRRVLAEVESTSVDTGFRVQLDENMWEAEELSSAALDKFDDPKRNRVIAETWKAQHGKTLVFASTIRHANDLARSFAKYQPRPNVQVLHTGEIPHSVKVRYHPHGNHFTAEEREMIRRSFGAPNDRIDVLISVNLYVMGVDFPAVRTLFMARPTLSPVLYAQMKGRGLRGPAFGGTEKVTIVDFIDQAEAHAHLSSRLMTFARESEWSKGVADQFAHIRKLRRRVEAARPVEARDRMAGAAGIYRVETHGGVRRDRRDWRWVADVGEVLQNGLSSGALQRGDCVRWIVEDDQKKGALGASWLRVADNLGIVNWST